MRGRVIHSVLEKEIDAGEIGNYVQKTLLGENESTQIPKGKVDELLDSITNELKAYFESGVYKEIKSFERFENEYEIYSKENDYFLYGIIDKLIIADDKVIIIDYKTDNIKEDQIEERGKNYLPQLLFYTSLAGKKFRNAENFECRLIFIKHPESKFIRQFDKSDISKFRDEVKDIVLKIRNNSFKLNLNHCSHCHYAIRNNQCIKITN